MSPFAGWAPLGSRKVVTTEVMIVITAIGVGGVTPPPRVTQCTPATTAATTAATAR